MTETEPSQPIDERTGGGGAVTASRRDSSWPFLFGVPLLLSALFFQTITVVSGDYVSVVLIAVTLTILADVCFLYAFCRGGVISRWVSIVCLLPTFLVVADFMRRSTAGG